MAQKYFDRNHLENPNDGTERNHLKREISLQAADNRQAIGERKDKQNHFKLLLAGRQSGISQENGQTNCYKITSFRGLPTNNQ